MGDLTLSYAIRLVKESINVVLMNLQLNIHVKINNEFYIKFSDVILHLDFVSILHVCSDGQCTVFHVDFRYL